MATRRHIGTSLPLVLQRPLHPIESQATVYRAVHVSVAPSTSSIHTPIDLSSQTQAIPKLSGAGPFPQDPQFEVLGSPYSLLSVSLPSSATLYSRRGTLVGLNGKVEDANSTLSMLGPLRRAVLGIPFLYQKIVSTSPLTCLISTNTPFTSFAVIKLEGTVDWMIVQRMALLAWCGHSISVNPVVNRKLNLIHWGNSKISGRGLVALVGKGQIFQVVLKPGEEFIAHPNNILAYSQNSLLPPQLYRLPSTSLRLQIPQFNYGLPQINFGREFYHVMIQTTTWKVMSKVAWNIRMWARRTIWGDREFLKFQGPVTILVQSRTDRVADVIPKPDVKDMAITEPESITELENRLQNLIKSNTPVKPKIGWSPAATKVATVVQGGKVELADSDLQEFIRK